MLLTDYFTCEHNITWEYAKQCGVKHGVIRLPENKEFDITNDQHWNKIHKRFVDFGIIPIIIEPIPNSLHSHIKAGDEKRDESIDMLLRAFPIMAGLGINIICFNFMAYIGWLRTSFSMKERGGALVTGFDIMDFVPTGETITHDKLWDNYEYFIRAVIPEAEKYGIKLALHPDDPPVPALGNVSRIMTSIQNIKRAISIIPSESLGVTMCQASFEIMGENLQEVVQEFKDRIFFIHFRNVVGNRFKFRETFHDNGQIPMGKTLNMYKSSGIDVPIRVDHVPLMAGDGSNIPGYSAIGRLYAIGYLKGLLEQIS